jgi:hypothetical protein
MNLALISLIVNCVWYGFSSAFVLYKFTTFFTNTYKFIRFSGRLMIGTTNIVKKITLWKRVKSFWRRKPVLPLYQTDISELETEHLVLPEITEISNVHEKKEFFERFL